MSPKDADGMANSVDPDQTAPLVWSEFTLFAQAYLSQNRIITVFTVPSEFLLFHVFTFFSCCTCRNVPKFSDRQV